MLFIQGVHPRIFLPCASKLITQLRRFTNLNGSLYKDNRVVNCYPKGYQTLTVPSHPEEDISFTNEYSLVATINHSGTLARGHYWAFVKDDLSDSWWKCDDRAVFRGGSRHFIMSVKKKFDEGVVYATGGLGGVVTTSKGVCGVSPGSQRLISN